MYSRVREMLRIYILNMNTVSLKVNSFITGLTQFFNDDFILHVFNLFFEMTFQIRIAICTGNGYDAPNLQPLSYFDCFVLFASKIKFLYLTVHEFYIKNIQSITLLTS